MKVIDLLNKIANGEEVPKKFMVDGNMLYIGEDKFIEYANGERIEWFIYPSWLNEEVEIIEEEKKIPEKLDLYEETQNIIRENNYKLVYHDIHKCIVSLECKYNEIIDYLESKGE